MSDAVVGSIEVALRANTAEFDRGMRAVVEKLGGIEAALGKMGSKTSEATEATGRATAKWASLYDVAIKGAMKLVSVAMEGVDQARAQAEANTRLGNVLRSIGADVDAVTDLYGKQADTIERLTGMDDTQITNMQRLALNYGVQADKVTTLIDASVALSEATGQDVNAAMMSLIKSMDGTIDRSLRLVPGVKDLTEAQLRHGDALSVVSDKYGDVVGNKDSFNRAVTDMTVAWGDFTKALGKAIIEFGPLIRYISGLAVELNVLIDSIAEFGAIRGMFITAVAAVNPDLAADYVEGARFNAAVGRFGQGGSRPAASPVDYGRNAGVGSGPKDRFDLKIGAPQFGDWNAVDITEMPDMDLSKQLEQAALDIHGIEQFVDISEQLATAADEMYRQDFAKRFGDGIEWGTRNYVDGLKLATDKATKDAAIWEAARKKIADAVVSVAGGIKDVIGSALSQATSAFTSGVSSSASSYEALAEQRRAAGDTTGAAEAKYQAEVRKKAAQDGQAFSRAMSATLSGGPMAGLQAVLSEAFGRSQAFQRIAEIGSRMMGRLIAAVEPLASALEPLAAVFGEIVSAIADSLAPVLEHVKPVIEMFGEVVRGFALVHAYVIKGLGSAWNAIISAIQWVLRKIDKIVPGDKLNDLADSMGNAKVNMDGLNETIENLKHPKIDDGLGLLDDLPGTLDDINDSGEDLGDTLDKVNASLTNVPEGFKVARSRYMASDPTRSGFEGVAAGNTITAYITSTNPQEIAQVLLSMAERKSYLARGTVLPGIGPYGAQKAAG